METMLEYLEPRAKELRDSLTHFMLIHSSIEPRKPEEVICIGPEGDRYYGDMDKVAMKMQAYLSECYKNFCTAIEPMLENQPEDIIKIMSKTTNTITRTIEHRLTFCENTKSALDLALKALDEQMKILKAIYEENTVGN